MRNDVTRRLAIWLAAVCICVCSAAVSAQGLSNGINYPEAGNGASLQGVLSRQDDSEGCERFPADQVFGSFAQALKTPEKVRCLSPNVEGEMVKMKRLPPGLGKLVNLEVLSLSCLEELEALPEEIGNLKKLRELIIDNGNGCSMNISLPRSIGNLENLRMLRLYGALDPTDTGDGRTRQRKSNPLPDTIGNLRRLEVLDIGRNGLAVVPPQLARLTQLKTLRMDYNRLRVVPAFVGNFKNLKELSLHANRKVSLPVSLASMPGLAITMGNNSLKLTEQRALRTRFPKAIFSFENEYEDESANEVARKPKPQPRRKG